MDTWNIIVGWARSWRSGVLVLLLAGCAGAEFNRNANAPTYPPYEGEVMLLGSLPPADQFERLGVVIARGVGLSTEERLRQQLKKAAARNGANALVLQSKLQTIPDGDGGSERRLAAWAIRVR